MCMLTFLPPNVLPNVERLRNGTISNRDGHGWAIVVLGDDGKGRHIITGHSMSAGAAIDAFKLTREKHPEGPALFHSRYTTGGLVDESNCHPYVVNGDPRTILAHNGVLPWKSLRQPAKDDRSDTRYFAEMWGDMLYPDSVVGDTGGLNFNLNSKRGRKRLRGWLGNPNKFVILTVDPTFRRNFYIINSEQGVWENDGCWYSNTGYKAQTYGIGRRTYVGAGWGYQSPLYGYGWDDEKPVTKRREGSDVWTRLAQGVDDSRYITDKHVYAGDPVTDSTCEVCGAHNAVKVDLNYCAICGTCQDCYGDTFDEYSDRPCECFWPTGTHPGRQARVSAAFAASESEVTNLGYPSDDDGAQGARGAWWEGQQQRYPRCPRCALLSCPGGDEQKVADCTSAQDGGLWIPAWSKHHPSNQGADNG